MYLLIVVMVVWYGNGTTSELLVKEYIPQGKEACEQFRDNIVKSYNEVRVSQGTQVDARCILVEGE